MRHDRTEVALWPQPILECRNDRNDREADVNLREAWRREQAERQVGNSIAERDADDRHGEPGGGRLDDFLPA